MYRCILAMSIAVLALTGRAQATLVTYNYTGGTVNIPNNTVNGVALNINITDTFDLLSFRSITINGNHTWIGDLAMTLTHVQSGRTIDLIRRPGKTIASAGFGDSSNWAGFTFSNVLAVTDANNPRVIEEADLVNQNQNVPNQIYRPTTNTFNFNGSPNYTGESITNLNTTFDPLTSIAGTWRLYVQDLAVEDVGVVTGFSITLDVAIPEPSPAPLLGCALLIGGVGHWVKRRRGQTTSPPRALTASIV